MRRPTLIQAVSNRAISNSTIRAFLLSAALALAAGCASNPQNRQQLDAGEQALRAQNYDKAIRSADLVISSSPTSNDLAEAYYLRGSAIEQRNPKPDMTAAAADLAAARLDYIAALNQYPPKPLESRLHGQLGNVAYFQDDYATALQQWAVAYDQLENLQWKQWVLYRMGICQQRLGRFVDADHTFSIVQREYPNTEVAARSAAREGVRGFYVQVGAFSQPGDAQKAAAAVTAIGSIPVQAPDRGLTVVRTSGVPSFTMAAQMRLRLVSQYPDARVLP
jgi:tetratricopeptide (TPR) repeat protein